MMGAVKGLGVDFTEGEKPENPEKNPGSTGQTSYKNSTRMSSKFFENQHGAIGGHPSSYNSGIRHYNYSRRRIQWPYLHINEEEKDV